MESMQSIINNKLLSEGIEPMRIACISASARNKDNMPDRDGKTKDIMNNAIKNIKNVEFDIIDLSVKKNESRIQPCNGCVSTSGAYHCHYPCSCYNPDIKLDNQKFPDFMYDNDIYDRLKLSHGIMIFTPVNWFSVPTQLKALFDRLTCISATLGIDDAVALTDGDIKDSNKTRELSKLGKYNHLVKNHYENKYAAFFVHGDGGADDYREYIDSPDKLNYYVKPEPPSMDVPFERTQIEELKNSIMSIVWQCRYSGIYVPDDLIKPYLIGKGIPYAENDDSYKNDKLFKIAETVVIKLIKHIKNYWRQK